MAALALKEGQLRSGIKQTTSDLQRQNTQLGGQKVKFDGLGNSINQMSRELPAFTYSMQTGFLALSNNIPIFADEIARLKAQNDALVASGQKGVPVWKQVVKGLFSWGTALSLGVTLLTIYGKEIGEFFGKLFKGEKAFNALRESQEALNKAFESNEYKNAIKDITELNANVELAKKGQIDAADVVDQYNESLGKAAGAARDLAEVEQSLIKNQDAYLQMMLYKAAANLALDESAQVAYEAAQEQLEIENELQKVRDGLNRTGWVSDRKMSVGRGSRSEYARFLDEEKRLVKELEEFQADSAKKIEERNQLFSKLNETAQSFGLDAFLKSGKDGDKDGAAIIRQRQSLLDRIADLDREYARKKLDDDEAELQALRDKFAKIRELVTRFNADPKNKNALIGLSDLDAIQAGAESTLTSAQAAKKAADRKKKIDAAQAQADKQAAEQLAAEQKKYAALLDQLMDYQEQREAIENQFYDNLILLAEKYEGEDFEKKVAALKAQKEKELAVVDDAAFKESELYRQMNEDVLSMTRQQITQQLALLQDALQNGFFTAADGTAMKLTKEQQAALEKVIGDTEKFLDQSAGAEANKAADNLAKIGAAFSNLSNALQDINPELAATLETMGDLAQVGSDAASAVASFSNGDIVGGISSTINAIAGVFTMAAKSRASAKAAAQELAELQHEAEEGELRLTELIRKRNLERAKEIELTLEGIKAQREALKLAQQQTDTEAAQVFNQLQNQSFVSGSTTEKFGGFLGIGRKSRVVNEYSALLGKTFEEIEALFEKGQLEERAAALFEQLRKLKDEGADINAQLAELQKQANEVFTGTTANSISDGIIQGLKDGNRAVEDFAGNMEQLLQDAILNAIKYQVLEQPLQELYKQFAAFAESDGELTEDEARQIRDLYKNTVQNAIDAYDDFSKVLDQGALSGAQQRGLAGAIRREMTEETGSELTGLFRGQFDITKKHLILDEARFVVEKSHRDATLNIMANTAKIEENTRNSWGQLVLAVAELKKISTNTVPRQGARGAGVGG